MRNLSRSAVGAILLSTTVAAGLPGQVEGTWTAGPREDGRVQLGINVEASNWSSGFAPADLRGLTEARLGSPTSTPVEFDVVREPGTFRMEGTARQGRGSGHFRFFPDRAFTRALASLGVAGAESAGDRELMNLALAGATVARAREFVALGFDPLTMRDLFQLSVHGVTPEYVREMRALGLADTNTVRGITRLSIHGVTREFVRGLEAVGYRDLDRRQLLQMGIHGVTPAFIRELREAGFEDLSPETLVRMRIHGIDAGFVRRGRG